MANVILPSYLGINRGLTLCTGSKLILSYDERLGNPVLVDRSQKSELSTQRKRTKNLTSYHNIDKLTLIP